MMIRAILCSAAAVGTCLTIAGTASATGLRCDPGGGPDPSIGTACRSGGPDDGHARAVSMDGVGRAGTGAGALALALGAIGGAGASEAAAGLPVAIGVGPDALAYTALDESGRVGVSIALEGSRAQVISADRTAVCLGAAAFAWDSRSGASCLATPMGLWRGAATALP
ncbi:DUF6764 family protein [Nocardia sp. NPDC003482]